MQLGCTYENSCLQADVAHGHPVAVHSPTGLQGDACEHFRAVLGVLPLPPDRVRDLGPVLGGLAAAAVLLDLGLGLELILLERSVGSIARGAIGVGQTSIVWAQDRLASESYEIKPNL